MDDPNLIMSVSLETYLASASTVRELADYVLRGVNVAGELTELVQNFKTPKSELAKHAPRGTEVIVNYRVLIVPQSEGGKVFYEADGIALIPHETHMKLQAFYADRY
jgi:hypothetical protein